MFQNNLTTTIHRGATISVIVLLVVLAFSLGAQTPSGLAIKITSPMDAQPGGDNDMFPISGEVTGGDTRGLSVVIYARAGSTWFVQPFIDSPWTEIKTGGKWETETHGGSSYAALLVRRATFKPSAQVRTLPSGDAVITRDVVAPKKQ